MRRIHCYSYSKLTTGQQPSRLDLVMLYCKRSQLKVLGTATERRSMYDELATTTTTSTTTTSSRREETISIVVADDGG